MGLSVKRDTTCANILAIIFCPFLDFSGAAYYNTQVVILLSNQEYFNIPQDKVGRANSFVIFTSFFVCLLIQPFYGYIFELVGRVGPLTIGPIALGIMTWMIPQTSPNFVTLCFIRSLVSLFTGFLIMNPLIADYIKSESRG